ncbi:hypothetical protein Ait01nite_032320 [Actinoplanes italicus]|uniref:Uncharacterized protein n=1 Tax=Actinoplanes italicus TaxID=113567 RepID=A0A2T0KJI1_9ACTN|nr:hypothetical protein [Actinoplanes italicus]PRX23685.1 hypothetical protein CLV67_103434 [Actinoplanes italicus]GIE30187.1 hypothetical protein Ait01nite_032320 [Actinoplanes italicus]
MAAWVLIPSLVQLRTEFNAIAPGRDKGADGAIGDSSHTSSSDHTPDEDSRVLRDHDADSKNEVHALDIDSTGPWPAGRSFRSLVMAVIAGERAKWLDPDDMCRLNYVIFDRKIYDKDNDFEPRDYGGSDPHTNHAHFSGRYETRAESDTRPWGVEEDDMATAKEIVDELLSRDIVMADGTRRTVRTLFAWEDARQAATRKAVLDALAAYNAGDDAAIESLRAQVLSLPAATATALAGQDLLDEEAVAAQVAESLPDGLAELVAQKLAERLAS